MRFSIGADTNVLFSGLYYGAAASSLIEAVRFNKIDLYQSEYLRDELFEVSVRNRMPLETAMLFYNLANVHVVTDDSYYSKEEFDEAKPLIRDEKDIPVYVFAKKLLSVGKIDYFVSGDKDLLQAKVRKSLQGKIVSLAEFNELLQTKGNE
ncbi:MAG: hypothetical protein UY87_C0087G0005 [Candidatus Peribacteria bacterium GW2011_GWC2_54_8]|nr:MAG: hypothetical protein UY87_C0087G0005 [Candidatus Peribacteria bacterium GW2011_GWC2_54_8]